jgi:hypothetical protein
VPRYDPVVWSGGNPPPKISGVHKGKNLATDDAIGVLNSDDFYSSSDVIENLVKAFSKEIDIVIGDVAFVDCFNVQKGLRFVSGSGFAPWLLRFGWMPPHPATFMRKNVYETFGHYKTDFAIAADYDFFVRTLIVGRMRTIHIRSFDLARYRVFTICRKSF